MSQKLTFDDIYHNEWKVDLSLLASPYDEHASREGSSEAQTRSADREVQTEAQHDEYQTNGNKIIKMLEKSRILRIETDIYDEAKFLEQLKSTNYQFEHIYINFCHWTTYQTISNVLEFIYQCKKIGTCSVKLLGVNPLEIGYGKTNNKQQFAYVMDFVTLLTQMKNVKQVKLFLIIKKDYDLSKFIDIDIKSQTSGVDSMYGFIHRIVEF
jgi:hypothetical protein